MSKFAVFSLFVLLVACGGDGLFGLDLQAPNTVDAPLQGASINNQVALTMQFDESISPVTLGGTLAAEGCRGQRGSGND